MLLLQVFSGGTIKVLIMIPHMQVGVYRMSDELISCSLADAAATPSYMNYLEMASKDYPSLHVIYINTSLETKAYAHELVPTITCTSSNVMPTILQVEIFYSFLNFIHSGS